MCFNVRCMEYRNREQGSRTSKMFFSNTLSVSIGFMKELVAIVIQKIFSGKISLQH